ncbi:MAG: TetR family transcriptional regulator [Myxococcales bacterium]|nr:TetR family transcriptional regulator [Myxococcales bacterium]
MVHKDEVAGHEPPARRGRRREVRGEAILDAAMRILATEGLEAVTLQRVGREMDYVAAALYRYFPSKDALLAAMQRRAVTVLHERFAAERVEWEGAMARSIPSVRALGAITAAARFYVDLPRSEPEAWCLVAVLMGDPRRVISNEEAARTAPLLFAFLADVEALFAEAARTEGLAVGEARVRTLVFWATLQGIAQMEKLRSLAPGAPSVSALGMAAVEALLSGWGAERAALRAALRAVERRS